MQSWSERLLHFALPVGFRCSLWIISITLPHLAKQTSKSPEQKLLQSVRTKAEPGTMMRLSFSILCWTTRHMSKRPAFSKPQKVSDALCKASFQSQCAQDNFSYLDYSFKDENCSPNFVEMLRKCHFLTTTINPIGSSSTVFECSENLDFDS